MVDKESGCWWWWIWLSGLPAGAVWCDAVRAGLFFWWTLSPIPISHRKHCSPNLWKQPQNNITLLLRRPLSPPPPPPPSPTFDTKRHERAPWVARFAATKVAPKATPPTRTFPSLDFPTTKKGKPRTVPTLLLPPLLWFS